MTQAGRGGNAATQLLSLSRFLIADVWVEETVLNHE
jgi:hypothetical protein